VRWGSGLLRSARNDDHEILGVLAVQLSKGSL
jgi:hypothetical protein